MSEELDRLNFKDSKSIYDDVTAPRTDKHGGYIALDGVVVCQTMQCRHCQKHFPVRKGSGEIRGFCMKCMGPTCGKVECVPCMPWAKRADLIEAAERKRRIVDSYLIGNQ